MAYIIHIRVISVRHLLTLCLVTLVMTYQYMLDETIDVENMEMGI